MCCALGQPLSLALLAAASRFFTLRVGGPFIGCEAFGLSTADHALSDKRSARFGYDRALRFAAAVGMKIDDNPVSDLAKFVGAGGV
jgi:hypothetical protein